MGANDDGRVLSEDQLLALTSVLDQIIPERADGGLPAAGQLGIGHYVCEHAGDALPIIAAGLAALDLIAKDRGASGFAALPSRDRAEVLGEVESGEPAFLATVIFHTYTGYYIHPRISEALGLPPGPPHPDGYEVEATDLSILDPVRRRRKLYRE